MVQTVEELYKRIKENEDSVHCEIAVSYLEVSNQKKCKRKLEIDNSFCVCR
jgi:hypothetical protein